MVMIDDSLELSKKRFENRDDLLNSVHNFAFTYGYAISIKDSRRDRYVIIGCDRGGNYRNRGKLSDETRKRKTSSRLVNCPFEVVGKQKDGSWILEIVDVLHNDISSLNISGHPSCRRLSLEEILRVKDMMKSGIPTRQILSSLRQNNPKLLATSQSFHNMKTKIFKELLDGRSIMQALLDEFGNSGFAYNVGYDVESQYYKALQTFETKHRERVIVLNYIRSTWIPYKERFVKAWTERYMHLGNRVTSKVEGAHATIKKYLQSSMGNLYGVSNRICLAIENQFQEFKTQLGSEKMRIPHRFRVPLFKELITHVSIFSMDEILKQCELAKSELELSACKCHFGATMGLPCVHMMKIKKYEALQLSDIHKQWRIDTKSFVDSDTLPSCKDSQLDNLLGKIKKRYHEWPISQQEVTLNQISHLINETPPFLYEPNIDSHRGRPLNSKKRKAESSTKRDPSAFEIVEKARKCSLCKGFGHNIQTCRLRGVESSSQSTHVDALDLTNLQEANYSDNHETNFPGPFWKIDDKDTHVRNTKGTWCAKSQQLLSWNDHVKKN